MSVIILKIGSDNVYNEAIKWEYINTQGETFLKARKWVFEAVGRYESKVDKDACIMDPQDAISAMEYSGLEEVSSVRQAIATLSDYTNWCIENGVTESSPRGFSQINVDDIDFSNTFKDVLYKDDLTLIKDLESVASFSTGTPDVLVFLFSWLGLFRPEMIALRDKDVDLEGRVIIGQDGAVLASDFSDKVVDALSKYRKCQVSTRMNGNTIYKVVKDNSVDSFFRRMCSENSKKFGIEYTVRQLESSASHLAKRFVDSGGNQNRLTIANVWRSGCLYRLWRAEQETGLDMGNTKRRDYIEKAFRKKKNYTNTARMYRWYKKVFWE